MLINSGGIISFGAEQMQRGICIHQHDVADPDRSVLQGLQREEMGEIQFREGGFSGLCSHSRQSGSGGSLPELQFNERG